MQLRTDSEKRSLAESGLNWYGEPEEKAQKKMDYDSGSLKMEHSSSKWRRERSESCDEAPGKGELKKPVSLGPPGSLKKGKTPPVAVTSPITHTAQTLKVAGEAGTNSKIKYCQLGKDVTIPFTLVSISHSSGTSTTGI